MIFYRRCHILLIQELRKEIRDTCTLFVVPRPKNCGFMLSKTADVKQTALSGGNKYLYNGLWWLSLPTGFLICM